MNGRNITRSMLAGLLVLACLNTSAAPPMTQAEQRAAAAEASAFGQSALNDAEANMPEFTENAGERGSGKVNISGITMDAGKLVPHADKTKADKLNRLADSANDLNTLHQETEKSWAESANDRGIHGQAVRTAERSTTDAMAIRPDVQNDDLIWESSLPAIGEGQSGKVLGQDQGQCTTTTRVEKKPSPGTISEEVTCDRIPPVDETAWCTREWKDVPVIKEEIRTKYGVLSVNNETGGNMCSRTRQVNTNTTSTQGTRTATLGINNNIGGLSCARWRTVSQTSTPPQTGTIQIDSGRPIEMNGFCVGPVFVAVPSGSEFEAVSRKTGNKAYIVSKTETSTGTWLSLSLSYGRCRDRKSHPWWINWTGPGGTEKGFGVQESGNCGDTGTPACPVKWNCAQSAPATIGGIAVTPGDVQGLPALFPGAANTCLRGELHRQCPGLGALTTNVSIADLIPAETTSLTNFNWTVTNPQPGVTVSLLQTPSVANNWVARFSVNNSNRNTVAPRVTLTWTAHKSTEQWSVVDSGNCSDSGSNACSAIWTCTKYAPTWFNGIQVTAGMVSGLPRLFPGASATCVSGALNRICGGSSTLGTNISIADQIPPGVTEISDLSFQVLNPQNGVSVQMHTQPTYGNGWVAGFNVTRSNWKYTPNPVNVRITFKVKITSTEKKIVDDGDCSVTGDGVCKTNLRCVKHGAANGTPLYPDAPNTCIKAELFLNCKVLNDGESCHETEQGTVCEIVEGGPIDTCGELRKDPNCTLQRSLCNEDAWAQIGNTRICRIWADVYQCKKEIPGEETIIHEDTVCHGNLALCADGSCATPEPESESTSMRKIGAILVIREAMVSDYEVVNQDHYKSRGGGSTSLEFQVPGLREHIGRLGDALLSTFIADAQAQATNRSDPKVQGKLEELESLPGGFDKNFITRQLRDAIPSNPDQFQQADGNYTMDTLRFFVGKSSDCKKQLGGLLNCCGKAIDPPVTNRMWWDAFGEHLRKGIANNLQCQINQLTPNQKQAGSDLMGAGANFNDLMRTFTGPQQQLSGGGQNPQCGVAPNLKQVNDGFMREVRKKVFSGLGKWFCGTDEKELSTQIEIGNCSYLGSYCRRKILGKCLDRRHRYCCFNSPMTRQIRETLRDRGIKDMGSAKHPDCSGISPRQFAQMNAADMGNTEDLEGRMLMGGMFSKLDGLFDGSGGMNFLELLTGSGSSVNDGRINALDRVMSQLEGTDPDAADNAINEFMAGFAAETDSSEPTASVPGEVSFTTGFRRLQHGPNATEREVHIGIIRHGNAPGVSVRVTASGGTAVRGRDYQFNPQTLSWDEGDDSEKTVTLTLRNAKLSAPVTLELRLGPPGGGAAIGGTGVMQIEILPGQ